MKYSLKLILLFTFASCLSPVFAQEATTAIVVTPSGGGEFCYYGGLAYSKNAVLAVDITNRRESPQATQKALLECQTEQPSERLVWKRVSDE